MNAVSRLILISIVSALLISASTGVSTRSVGEYDPWADLDNDGDIDIFDVVRMTVNYGTSGEPYAAKAAIEFDGGWVDITDKCGQEVILEHGLNSMDVIVDITGKTTLDGGVHQRHLGCTGYTPGWSTTYGGPNSDAASSVIQTSDGGYALAGNTHSFGVGDADAWLVKTDANGVKHWSATYGGPDNDFSHSVVQTTDGGYALAGQTYSFGAGSYDFWLVKTDAGGNLQWNRTYGGVDADYAMDMVQTTDGGYALAGFTFSFGAGMADYWLVKTDASGFLLWSRTYGGPDSDGAYSVVQTGDGGYALAGETYSFGAGMADGWLIRTDASGIFQWGRTWGGVDSDFAYSLVQTSDGGYALAGETFSFGAGLSDFWLVKTDANGIMQWERAHGGSHYDYAHSVVQTDDGGYALAGSTLSFGAGSWDAWLVKTDASGIFQWGRAYGGIYYDFAYSVVQTGDGGYTLAGYTSSFGAGGDDMWLRRAEAELGLMWTDSSLNAIWLHRGATDPYWNFVRVRVWKINDTP